jgi:hypothetical protein
MTDGKLGCCLPPLTVSPLLSDADLLTDELAALDLLQKLRRALLQGL